MFRPVQHRSRFPRDNTPAIPASRNTRRPRPETGPEETGTRPLLATSYLPPRCAPGPGHTHADGRPRPRCRARAPRPPAAAGPAAGTPPGRQGLAPAGGLAAPKRRPARRREDADGRRGRPDRAVPLLTEAGGGPDRGSAPAAAESDLLPVCRSAASSGRHRRRCPPTEAAAGRRTPHRAAAARARRAPTPARPSPPRTCLPACRFRCREEAAWRDAAVKRAGGAKRGAAGAMGGRGAARPGPAPAQAAPL